MKHRFFILGMVSTMARADQIDVPDISTVLPVQGAKLAGPLPAELQKYTAYVAVPVTQSSKQQAVSDLIRHLTGPAARERLAHAGYTAPE